MSRKDLSDSPDNPGKNWSKGNRRFITLGFLIIGVLDGLVHYKSTTNQSDVTLGLGRLWEEVNSVKNDVTEIKTLLRGAEKNRDAVDAELLLMQDRLRKVEIDEARIAADSGRRPG